MNRLQGRRRLDSSELDARQAQSATIMTLDSPCSLLNPAVVYLLSLLIVHVSW